MGNSDGVLFARLGKHMIVTGVVTVMVIVTCVVNVQSRCFCLVLSLVDSLLGFLRRRCLQFVGALAERDVVARFITTDL